jgi:outer membrane protein
MQEIEEIRTRIENFLSIAEADVRKNQEELYQPVQDKIRKAINATDLVKAKLGLQ